MVYKAKNVSTFVPLYGTNLFLNEKENNTVYNWMFCPAVIFLSRIREYGL